MVATGAGVAHVREGDRVGVPWLYSACGHCEYCYTGWETLCHAQQNTGYSVQGSFAEYVLADPAYVGHIPDSLSFIDAAPILCAGVTVYKGLKETEVKPGEWVVISGIGGLGHLAVQYAKAMGMHVVAVDISPEKLRLAKEVGPTWCCKSSPVLLNRSVVNVLTCLNVDPLRSVLNELIDEGEQGRLRKRLRCGYWFQVSVDPFA